MTQKFENIALIGLGLIASSMAWRLKSLPNPPRIQGTARSEATRKKASDLGFCDAIYESAAEAVHEADLVIFCTPIGAMGEIAREIAPHLKEGAVISDVGSVKQAVIAEIAPHLPDHVHFVPAHPLAGTEKSGPEAGFAELFINRWTIITPLNGADEHVARLREFWEMLGAKVDEM